MSPRFSIHWWLLPKPVFMMIFPTVTLAPYLLIWPWHSTTNMSLPFFSVYYWHGFMNSYFFSGLLFIIVLNYFDAQTVPDLASRVHFNLTSVTYSHNCDILPLWHTLIIFLSNFFPAQQAVPDSFWMHFISAWEWYHRPTSQC